MKKLMIASLGMMLAMNMNAAKKPKTNALQFNPESGVKASLTMPDGKVVNYTAYNKLYFVTNVEDSTYQYMNIFVPEGANEQTPIFLRTYVGAICQVRQVTHKHRMPAGALWQRAMFSSFPVAVAVLLP